MIINCLLACFSRGGEEGGDDVEKITKRRHGIGAWLDVGELLVEEGEHRIVDGFRERADYGMLDPLSTWMIDPLSTPSCLLIGERTGHGLVCLSGPLKTERAINVRPHTRSLSSVSLAGDTLYRVR